MMMVLTMMVTMLYTVTRSRLKNNSYVSCAFKVTARFDPNFEFISMTIFMCLKYSPDRMKRTNVFVRRLRGTHTHTMHAWHITSDGALKFIDLCPYQQINWLHQTEAGGIGDCALTDPVLNWSIQLKFPLVYCFAACSAANDLWEFCNKIYKRFGYFFFNQIRSVWLLKKYNKLSFSSCLLHFRSGFVGNQSWLCSPIL